MQFDCTAAIVWPMDSPSILRTVTLNDVFLRPEIPRRTTGFVG